MEDLVNYFYAENDYEKNSNVTYNLARKQVLNNLMRLDFCARSVNNGYVQDKFGALIQNKTNTSFDAVFALTSDYHEYEKSDMLTNCLRGFLICELGECQDKPYDQAYSVAIICSGNKPIKTLLTPNAHIPGIKGIYLMGAFLYNLIAIGQKAAVLELASSYQNIPGFLSYSKLGFVRNFHLFSERCFNDSSNLPMVVNLIDTTGEDIIKRCTGEISIKQEDPAYDWFRKISAEKQNNFAKILHKVVVAEYKFHKKTFTQEKLNSFYEQNEILRAISLTSLNLKFAPELRCVHAPDLDPSDPAP